MSAELLILGQARNLIAAWPDDYNHCCSHTSLNGITPPEFLNLSTNHQTMHRINV